MKKKMKKLLALLLATTFCMGLCACGGSETEEETLTGTIELSLWFPYGSLSQAYLEEITDAFNASQDDYYIRVMNSGSVSEVRSKLEATIDPKDYPDLIAGQTIATCYYNDAKYIKKINDFIEADETDWTTGLYQSVRNVYSNLDGELIGWPLGVSSSGYWVNVDAVKAAGYTVEDITSFEKLAEISKAIVNKGICKYGVAYANTGVELIDMLTLQGVPYVNKDNGFSGEATKSMLMEGDTYKSFKKATEIMAELFSTGVSPEYGAQDYISEFNNENLAFCYGTNSNAHYIVGVPDFEWAFVPSVGLDDNAKYKGVALTEGTGLYMCNTENEKKMQGAYEFIKFAAQPEYQALYCTSLGYVPYTDEGMQHPDYQTYLTESFPSAQGIIDKMKAAPETLRTPYTGAFDEMCSVTIELLSYISVDPKGDLESYMEQSAYLLEEGLELLQEQK